MSRSSRNRWAFRSLPMLMPCSVFLCASLCLFAINHALRAHSEVATEEQAPNPREQMLKLGMKFNGAASCEGANCHDKQGMNVPVVGPNDRGREYTIWKKHDKHSSAFNKLRSRNADAKNIAAKLKINDATKDQRCLSCHALNVADFNLNEGNTCESCHGPS